MHARLRAAGTQSQQQQQPSRARRGSWSGEDPIKTRGAVAGGESECVRAAVGLISGTETPLAKRTLTRIACRISLNNHSHTHSHHPLACRPLRRAGWRYAAEEGRGFGL